MIVRAAMCGAVAAAAAFAHFTWISPAEVLWEAGQTVAIRVGHGHQFPQSEEAISSKAELFVIAPSGNRTALKPSAVSKGLTANYAVKERGVHRIVLNQDRGVVSRTSKGLLPGGRDQHPDAVQSYRSVRTAVAYAGRSLAGAGPAGLEFEIAGEYANGTWQLSLLNHGKPVVGAAIEFLAPGSREGILIGKTGSDGRTTYRPAAGAKGPMLFIAEGKAPAPRGAKYDSVSYSVSLYVSW